MEMANYIFSILKSQPLILFSWGFISPKALEDDKGLIFSVNGFKHKGWVKVIYNEGKDLFEVILIDDNNNEVKKIEDVYIDLLVEVIDYAVERTNDYDDRVREFYSE